MTSILSYSNSAGSGPGNDFKQAESEQLNISISCGSAHPESMSVKTAARILGVSKGKIRKFIRTGILGAEKIAGQYCITRFPELGIGALPHGQPRQITVLEFLEKHRNITGD